MDKRLFEAAKGKRRKGMDAIYLEASIVILQTRICNYYTLCYVCSLRKKGLLSM